jgi:hypothetical protein
MLKKEEVKVVVTKEEMEVTKAVVAAMEEVTRVAKVMAEMVAVVMVAALIMKAEAAAVPVVVPAI